MDANTIITLISSVGFPIVACSAMAWYVKYTNDTHAKQIDDMNTRHSEEIKNVTTAIENNTLVVQKLLTIIEGREN